MAAAQWWCWPGANVAVSWPREHRPTTSSVSTRSIPPTGPMSLATMVIEVGEPAAKSTGASSLWLRAGVALRIQARLLAGAGSPCGQASHLKRCWSEVHSSLDTERFESREEALAHRGIGEVAQVAIA